MSMIKTPMEYAAERTGAFNLKQKAPPLPAAPSSAPATEPKTGVRRKRLSVPAEAPTRPDVKQPPPRPSTPDIIDPPAAPPTLPEVESAIEAVGGKLSLANVQGLIAAECDALKALLLAKNRKYGNSALSPKRVFSKASTIEQLYVRIDDKLSRIEATGLAAADEDTLLDLQGYITLLRVARRLGLG